MRILILACAAMAMGGTAGAQYPKVVDCQGISVFECRKGWAADARYYNTKEYGEGTLLTLLGNEIVGAQCEPNVVLCGGSMVTEVPQGANVTLGTTENRSWHYVSQTYGGHVSALGNLTKEECDGMVKRSRNEPSTDEEIRGAAYLRKKREAELDRCRAIDAPATTVEMLACISAGSYVHVSDDVSEAECYQ